MPGVFNNSAFSTTTTTVSHGTTPGVNDDKERGGIRINEHTTYVILTCICLVVICAAVMVYVKARRRRIIREQRAGVRSAVTGVMGGNVSTYNQYERQLEQNLNYRLPADTPVQANPLFIDAPPSYDDAIKTPHMAYINNAFSSSQSGLSSVHHLPPPPAYSEMTLGMHVAASHSRNTPPNIPSGETHISHESDPALTASSSTHIVTAQVSTACQTSPEHRPVPDSTAGLPSPDTSRPVDSPEPSVQDTEPSTSNLDLHSARVDPKDDSSKGASNVETDKDMTGPASPKHDNTDSQTMTDPSEPKASVNTTDSVPGSPSSGFDNPNLTPDQHSDDAGADQG